jgi:lipopolysaccharide export system protein LptC
VGRQRNKPKLDTYSKAVLIGKVSLFIGVASLSVGLLTVAKSNLSASEEAQRHVQELFKDRLLSRPDSVGMTESGASFRITAEQGILDRTSDGAERQLLEKVRVTLETASERTSHITADLGSLSSGPRNALLSGKVRGNTSDGYRLETEELSSNLELGTALSRGPVLLHGPNFTLNSGQMSVDFGANVERYVFSGGVTVVYAHDPLTQ